MKLIPNKTESNQQLKFFLWMSNENVFIKKYSYIKHLLTNINDDVMTCIYMLSPSGEFMMTSSKGNIFCVTGPLCGEFTSQQLIPLTKASNAELWCFLWSAPEQTVEQIIKNLVIWDAITLIMMSLQ